MNKLFKALKYTFSGLVSTAITLTGLSLFTSQSGYSNYEVLTLVLLWAILNAIVWED